MTARYNYGILLVREGDHQAALAELQQACELNPDDPSMLLTLAIVDMDQDEWSEAGKLLRRALALDGNNARVHRQYGILLARQDLARAEVELRTATRLDPSDGIALMQLCAVLDERGEHAEAERLFREACAKDPTRAEAYFRWILQHEPGQIPALVNLALLYMNERRWDAALPLLQEAVEQSPENAQATRLFGTVLLELGQYPRAESVLRRALELDPDDEVARSRLITLLRDEHRQGEATLARREALERSPDDPIALVMLAQQLDEAGSDEEATRLFIRARDVAPDQPAVYLAWGMRHLIAAGSRSSRAGFPPGARFGDRAAGR